MIAGNLNDLVRSITESTIPKWLYDYIQIHKSEVLFDLKLFGSHVIEGPDGQEIIIEAKGPKIIEVIK